MTSPSQQPTRTGTVIHIQDGGSLITLQLQTDDGETIYVPLDNKTFHGLLDAEATHPSAMIGRRAAYNGHGFWFLDDGGGVSHDR